MKVALVHDWLNTRVGGSEKVLIELSHLYPDAEIYTLLYRKEFYRGQIDSQRVKTSNFQRWPRTLTDRPRYLLPAIPTAIESFDLSGYDVVISSSNAFSKGIITPPSTVHISYCHTPMRFAWDYWPRYLDEQRIGPIKRYFAGRLISKLRVWDYYSSKRVDHWIANSHHVAKRIQKYYGAEARVINPPVELDRFRPADQRGDYFVTLSTLTPYKQVDQAIAACNQLKQRLVVIGDGFERGRLEAMAGHTIEFAGRVSDDRKAELLGAAQGLIVPQEEDFGIAMVEALASGAPVIAFGRGGSTEIVESGCGVLYPQNTVEALIPAIQKSLSTKYDPSALRRSAERFSASRFAKAITQTVEQFIEA